MKKNQTDQTKTTNIPPAQKTPKSKTSTSTQIAYKEIILSSSLLLKLD